MDLAALLPIAQDLPVTLPDGTATDVVLRVLGHDSTPFRACAKRFAQGMLDDSKPKVEELEQQNAELVASCIIGWKGLSKDGEPLPYSKEQAVELMLKPELNFLREQVEKFVSVRANFFRTGPAPARTIRSSARPT